MNPEPYAGKVAYRGEIAQRYDEDRMVEKAWAEEQEFIRRWVETMPSGSSLLDIPTGTGRFLEFYLARGLQVHAFDISEDMLAEVRRRHPAAVAANYDIRVADAEHIPLPDDSVDYAVSWRLFHLIPATVIEPILREFRRVCRGTIVVQVFNSPPGAYSTPAWQRWKSRLRPMWQRLRRKPADDHARPWSHITNYSHPEDVLRAAFGRAGLVIQQTCIVQHDVGFPARVFFLNRAVPPGGQKG